MGLPFPRVRVPSTPPRTASVRLLLALPLLLCLGASCLPSADDGSADAPPRPVSDLDAGERERLADVLAARSLDTATGDPRLSSALALEAAGLAHTDASAAAMARLAEPHRVMDLDSGGEPLSALAFAYQGRFLAGGTEGGRILVWDVYTGDTVLDQRAPGAVEEVALDTEGLLVAARHGGGGAVVWDVDSGTERARLDTGDASGAVFVSSWRGSFLEAQYLALGTAEGGARLWDTGIWEAGPRVAQEERLVSLGMTGHTRTLVTLTDDGVLGLWDATTRASIGETDLGAVGFPGGGFRLAPAPVGHDTIPVTGDEGVFVVSVEAVQHGDGPVDTPQYCTGVFCDEPSTRPSRHQHADTHAGPAAQGNAAALVTAEPAVGSDELVLWESPPVAVLDYRRTDSVTVPGRIALVAAPRTTSGLHVVAAAPTDGDPALWDLSRDPHAPYLDEEALTIALETRCAGAPVLLGPGEWERELPDLAYEPVCVRIQDEQATDTHGTTTGPTPPTPVPAAPTTD
ncbi:WD40 repeat domain-containing protein [Nocardiopsis dassonvillei]|uniref:WD40 repeat domain-containing protein n=1 Tax=Nocardiopsis dassonvillei TaxID=2014 RepID=UPI0036721311